jgi:general secretion pathway protein K
MMVRAPGPPRRSERGFALLFVLWFLVLLSAVAIHLTSSGRVEIALARNTVGAAKAEALADAGLVRAAFSLGDPRPEIGWDADGTPHRLTMRDGEVDIVAEDENGRINPNLASRDLLVQFFLALDAERDTAEAVSDAIMSRRNAAAATPGTPATGPQVAMPAASPSSPTPPFGAAAVFDSVDDLAGLSEMPAELLAAAEPYLSVYSKAAEPDPTHAPAVVRRALAGLPRTTGQTPPTAGPTNPSDVIIRATVRARTNSGMRFSRQAVIRIDPALPKGYAVLWWRHLSEAP